VTSSGPDKLAKRPEFDSVEAAARVSSFMEAAEHGRWQISRFTIADHDVKRALGRNIGRSKSAEEVDMRNARIVPPGEYVSLRRRATPEEGSALYEDGTPFDGWVPIMSDTPSEIHEHDDAFERAHPSSERTATSSSPGWAWVWWSAPCSPSPRWSTSPWSRSTAT
jgi:hypothetical protein